MVQYQVTLRGVYLINAGRTFSETTMTKGNVSDWAHKMIFQIGNYEYIYVTD